MSYDLLMAHFKTPASLAASLLAHGVTISPQAIYKWQKQGVPLDRAPVIERASDSALRCEQMCPGVEWIRDKRGAVTGYKVRVNPFRKPKRKAA